MTLNERFAEQAQAWADAAVPYVHRGTTRQGCDCTGLIIGCLQELGYLHGYKLRYYPKDWNLHAMADDHIQEEIGVVADRVIRCIPQTGDIVLFRFGKCIAHAGVVVKPGVFVHSHAGAGKVSYGLFRTPKWALRLSAVWRINEDRLRSHV